MKRYETALTCAHDLCFEQKIGKTYHNLSTENYHYYSREKSQFIALHVYRMRLSSD